MMKLLKSPAFILTILILSGSGFGYAQDSVRKAKPVTAKPAVKYNPYAKPKAATYKAAATPGQAPAGTAIVPQQVRPQPTTAENPALLTDKSLSGQYQYLLTKVYNYQRPLISALWKNYSDTLRATRAKLNDANAKLLVQTKRADTLQTQITEKDQTLSASNARMDSVSLLGIAMTKATYNWIMWGLVIGFGAIAAIMIARSGSHSREAKYRTKLYNELEEEYKNYKTKANEKEKKLARELQTERNKNDELLGNG